MYMLSQQLLFVQEYIENCFFAGYSLEEIATYCNTSVMMLLSYISDEEIEKMGKRKIKKEMKKRRNPLIGVFSACDSIEK